MHEGPATMSLNLRSPVFGSYVYSDLCLFTIIFISSNL